jgi:phosphoribosylanthranilate isomerase (EC 5.3.1.24)
MTPVKRTRIKFCGITRAQDAQAAVALGVDALGFVLVPESRRWIAPQDAAALARELPPLVSCVALFRNADAAFIERSIALLQPDLLQFHGEEPAGFCARFGRPWIKALAMAGDPPTPELLASYAQARACCWMAMPPAPSAARASASTGMRSRRSAIGR